MSSLSKEKSRVWSFANCQFFEKERRLTVSGVPVSLESKPLEVLQLLLEHYERVVTKDELLTTVWKGITSDQSLTVAIAKLRKVMGGARDSIIQNISGIGYRLAVPVSCREHSSELKDSLEVAAGNVIPGREQWKAVRPLRLKAGGSVWLASNSRTHELRVFSFAEDDQGMRALQQKVTVSRLLMAGAPDSYFEVPYDWNFTQKPFYIESPFYGLNLIEWFKDLGSNGPSLETRIGLVVQLAKAIAKAHHLGIVHNALRPSKVLLSRDDHISPGSWKVTVVGFSISPAQLPVPENDASFSSISDIELYRAPEHSEGIQNDIYAFGIVLYQTICGDFSALPLPGWEENVPVALLREAVVTTANLHPLRRVSDLTAIADLLTGVHGHQTDLKLFNKLWPIKR